MFRIERHNGILRSKGHINNKYITAYSRKIILVKDALVVQSERRAFDFKEGIYLLAYGYFSPFNEEPSNSRCQVGYEIQL